VSASPPDLFGPGRTSTRLTVVTLALVLFGVVLVFTRPFSGSWASAALWSLITFVPLGFNRRFRRGLLGLREQRAVMMPPEVYLAQLRRGAALPQPATLAGVAAGSVPVTAAPADGPVDVAATTAALAAALGRHLPTGFALASQGGEVVVWNENAALRRPLPAAGPGGERDAEQAVLAAARAVLGAASEFASARRVLGWPPARPGVQVGAVIGDGAVVAWYEEGGYSLLVLEPVPLVRAG